MRKNWTKGLFLAVVFTALLSLGAFASSAQASGRTDRDLISSHSSKGPLVAQRRMPPKRRFERARKCGRSGYWRPGRWQWRGGRYRWWGGRCMPRPKTWRRGCTWVRGHWAKRGRRMVWNPGRFRCGAVAPGPVAVGPRVMPPKRRFERMRKCGRSGYWRPGRWEWRAGRYRWWAGRCMPRPRTWRRGCTWVRGHWEKRFGRLVWQAGRFRCGGVAPTPVVVGPRVLPPKHRYERPRRCGRAAYWRPGRWEWRGGRYRWWGGRCMPRPGTWRRGCTWVRGRWQRRGRGLVWIAGRFRCGGAVAPGPVVVGPTVMPPKRRFERVRKCGRSGYWNPGRWKWAGRRWTWWGGRCVPRPKKYLRRKCRWVRGGWKRVGRHARWTKGHWRCR